MRDSSPLPPRAAVLSRRAALGLAAAVPLAAASPAAAATPSATPSTARTAARTATIGGDLLGLGGIQVRGASGLPKRLTARSWLVADHVSGEVLASYNAHRLLAPASTLKMLFADTVLKKFERTELHRVTDADLAGIPMRLQPRRRQARNHLHRRAVVARRLPALRERRGARAQPHERRRGHHGRADAGQGRRPAGPGHARGQPRRVRPQGPDVLRVRPDALRPARPRRRRLPRLLLDEDRGLPGGRQEDLPDPEHRPPADRRVGRTDVRRPDRRQERLHQPRRRTPSPAPRPAAAEPSWSR